jgi:hypothetical protein
VQLPSRYVQLPQILRRVDRRQSPFDAINQIAADPFGSFLCQSAASPLCRKLRIISS